MRLDNNIDAKSHECNGSSALTECFIYILVSELLSHVSILIPCVLTFILERLMTQSVPKLYMWSIGETTLRVQHTLKLWQPHVNVILGAFSTIINMFKNIINNKNNKTKNNYFRT